MVVKTYRGLLAHGAHDRIRLSTIRGKVGYRIKKFQLMPKDANENTEHIMKIYSVDPTNKTGDLVNFSDSDMLAAGMYWSSTSQASVHETIVVFDAVLFNQDIYVTCDDEASTAPMNYYIELEVIPLTDQAAEFTTLKDIRTQLTIS